MDCEYKDLMVCPFCGHEQSDSFDKEPPNDDGEVLCNACSATFHVLVNRSVSYTTDCGEDMNAHEWKKIKMGKGYFDCVRCAKRVSIHAIYKSNNLT